MDPDRPTDPSPSALQRRLDALQLRQTELELENAALRAAHAEERLLWSLSLQQMIASASPLAFFVVDNRSDEILYFNQRFCQLWGIEHLAERMRRGELKNADIIPACLAALADVPAFVASCAPLQAETNRDVVDDEIAFRDGRTVRRYSSHVRGPDDRYFGRFYMFEDITARKQAEADLLESRAKFSSAFEHAAIGMALVAPQGQWLRVNQAVCDLLGYSGDELLARTFQDVTHPEDLEADLAQVQRLLSGEHTTYQMEKRYIRRGGRVVWGWLSVSLVRAPTGEPRFFISQIVDITARKRAEAALRESEEKFSAAFLSSPVAMHILTLDGRIVEANRALCELVGRAPHELLGRTSAAAGLLDPEAQAELVAALDRAGDSLRNHELRLRHRDGSPRAVLYSAELFTVRGVPHRLGTVLDVTERRRAQATLRASEQRLSSIVDSAMDAIITVDEDQRILVFNAAACAVFRCAAADAIGQPLARFLPWRFRAAHLDQLRAFVNDPPTRVERAQITGLRADGEEFPAEVSRSHIEVQGRRIFTVILRDISARLAAEAARDALEAQLRVAQKMEAIGTLASGIAHDFNNILGAIYGYTELARQHAGPDRLLGEFLGEVSTATSRAAALVRQILAFSRQEQPQRQVIRLAPVIQEALQLLRAAVPSSVSFEVSLPPDTHAVLANATQIHQVIMNLGSNAAHAMRDQTGRMTLTLENCDVDANLAALVADLRPGPHVCLTVRDTGRGMDRATAERIFDPFFTTKAPGDGTGLGLSVVHGIMRGHEGAITVRSQPGDGTTFSLYFPAALGPPADAPGAAQDLPRGHGERILFVDDEETLGRLGKRMLERLGYTVEVETRPQAALAAVRARPGAYALVITDLTMPELRGTDLARQLRELRADLPVLLTSGHSADLTPAGMAAAGIHEVLLKPFSAEDLGRAIQRALGARPRP